MRDDRNAFSTTASAQMGDAELSRRLGRCQTAESIGILLGALLVAAGCISAFLWHNVLLLSALVFVGVALTLLLALPAQKKKKALLQQQLGSYFRSEQERIFGAEPEMPELRNLVQKLEAFANNGKVGGLILRGGSLTLALNTRYVSANVPDVLDLRDINGIRKWYTASPAGMAQLLELLITNPALTGEADKDVML